MVCNVKRLFTSFKLFIVSILALFIATSAYAAPPRGINLDTYTKGLNKPTAMAFSPSGILYIAEQGGKLRYAENGNLSSTPALSLNVTGTNERGLLGIAFDPEFQSTRAVYLYYTTSGGNQENRVSRFKFNQNNSKTVNPNEEVLLKVGSAIGYHNGGALAIGKDNMLYVGVGDSHDKLKPGELHNSQNLNNLLGKILRLNIAPGASLIPRDNPFANMNNRRGEIFAYGFRNPFTMGINRSTGQVFVNDVGQVKIEEINDVKSGKNYGWPECEGSCNKSGFENPIYQYNHDIGCAITGGTFYNATSLGNKYLNGYFFSDFCSSKIWFRDTNGSVSVFDDAEYIANALDFDVDSEGRLYVLLRNGSVIRYEGNIPTNRPPIARISASTKSGVVPLTVDFNAGQSEDPDGNFNQLKFSWDFGDGNNAVGANVKHQFTKPGSYNVILTATDANSASGKAETSITVTPSKTAPKAEILVPAEGATFSAGSSIKFVGSGTDTEDGDLPKGSFKWKVDAIVPADNIRGRFVSIVPESTGFKEGEAVIPNDIFGIRSDATLQFTLTVVDSQGAETKVVRTIRPQLAKIVAGTIPQGLPFSLNGKEYSKNISIDVVKGSLHKISADPVVNVGNINYTFQSWSNNLAREHQFKASATEEVVATFTTATPPQPTPTVEATPVPPTFTPTPEPRVTPTRTPEPRVTPTPIPSPTISDMTPRETKRRIRKLERKISRLTRRNERHNKRIKRSEQRIERYKSQQEDPNVRESRKSRIQSRIDRANEKIQSVIDKIELNVNMIEVAKEELEGLRGTV